MYFGKKQTVGACSTTACLGDLTELEVDAYVIPELPKWEGLTSVGTAVSAAGGSAGLAAFEKAAREAGTLPFGIVFPIRSGGSKAPWQLHTVSLNVGDGSFERVQLGLYNALRSADARNCNTVALPIMGRGAVGSLTPHESATAMLSAIEEYSRRGGRPLEIFIVAYQAMEELQALETVMEGGVHPHALSGLRAQIDGMEKSPLGAAQRRLDQTIGTVGPDRLGAIARSSASTTEKRITDFYRGGGADHQNRTLATILGWPDVGPTSTPSLELVHDYIQWLFPTISESSVSADAPILDMDTIYAFRSDPQLRTNVARSFDRMLVFYGLQRAGDLIVPNRDSFLRQAANWLTPGNHNHLRLTRIIRSLYLLGFEPEAAALNGCLQGLAQQSAAISDRTVRYWNEAATGYEPGHPEWGPSPARLPAVIGRSARPPIQIPTTLEVAEQDARWHLVQARASGSPDSYRAAVAAVRAPGEATVSGMEILKDSLIEWARIEPDHRTAIQRYQSGLQALRQLESVGAQEHFAEQSTIHSAIGERYIKIGGASARASALSHFLTAIDAASRDALHNRIQPDALAANPVYARARAGADVVLAQINTVGLQ